MLDSLSRIERVQQKVDKWLPRKGKSPAAIAPKLVSQLPEWAKPLVEPYRYKCLWGGRGSGKSWACADALLILGVRSPERVLCAREFQNSIQESVHHLLGERIEAMGLQNHYTVQRDRIFGNNGTEFIFKGVRHNVQSIKSMSGITKLWIEEAQTISANSWQILVPTIREPNSEIWATFNPDQPTDIIYQELVEKQRDNAYVARVNWDRNPHFPEVLDQERRDMMRTDPDAYQHIWEGGFWEKSDTQVLSGKWVIDEFEPLEHWEGPYLGADFGFAQDATTLVQMWIHDRTLYFERESYAIGLELDHTPARWTNDIPGCDRHIIYADCARPESISYLKRHGIPHIKGVDKWSGSVEDGIAFLRSFEKIVIHPSCKHGIEEARLWRYKTDRHSGAILPKLLPGNEHVWDGARYGLAPMIKRSPRHRRHMPIAQRNW